MVYCVVDSALGYACGGAAMSVHLSSKMNNGEGRRWSRSEGGGQEQEEPR